VEAAPVATRLARSWEMRAVSETTFGRLLGLFVLLVVAVSAAGVAQAPRRRPSF
jgi:hypothetical protein